MMTIFVDASVLVAVLGEETDAFEQLSALHSAPQKLSSALAIWETARALLRLRRITIDEAHKEVSGLLDVCEIEIVTIGKPELNAAVDAHQRYGKGNHPAKLNMSDCFAYACAKTNDARLLYKGDDFAQTDLA